MFKLYRTLRRHRKLAEHRDVNYENNRVAKFFIGLTMMIVVAYLIGAAILLSMFINGQRHVSSVEFICSVTPIIISIDFFVRFIAQQTPAQIIRPYSLLPIPMQTCVNGFIFSSLLSWGNTIWFCLFFPYIIMSVLFGYGILTSLFLCIFLLTIILINSQWYAIVRTLTNASFLYWALPVVFYAIIYSPLYIGSEAGFGQFVNFYGAAGDCIERHSGLPLLFAIAALAAVVYANMSIQRMFVRQELLHTETTKETNVSSYSFLNRFGETGMFLKLEIKTIIRNKNPRKIFVTSMLSTIILSIVITTSSVYDSSLMTNFWAFYDLVLFGSMILVRGLGNEGNFIDGLMVRHEKVLTILQAKYIFYSALTIIPFLLMLPMVIMGKWSLFMLMSYAIFSIGFQYFVLMQMVIYAKQTIPLNEKFISKGGIENNYIPLMAQMITLIVPNAIACCLQLLLGDTPTYIFMTCVGIAFIATSKMWLRNIYNRFMKRRYTNLEHFRATR